MKKVEKGTKVLLLSVFLGNTPVGFAITTESSRIFPTYRVERKACQGNTVDQITIPEGVTFIDKLAFADCPNLSSVSFPSTLQDIENAFVNCSQLESVDLSSATKLKCLAGSFQGCTNLTTVILSENLEEIGEGAFEGCINLASFPEIPSVKFIGSHAFKRTELTRTPLLNKVEHIGEGAFDTGKPILWDFGEFFWIDDPLGSSENWFVTYPEARGVRSGNKLTLNPTIETLDERSFSRLPWKDEVKILSLSPKIQSLETLKGLKGLQDLDVQKGYRLSSVSSTVFDECPNLNPATIIPPIEEDGAFYTVPSKDEPICSAFVLYGAQILSSETFKNCRKLTTVRLPDTLVSIGSEAFSGCSDLTFLDLPTSLQSIGNGAFSGCASLTSFDLPNALRILEDGVFKGCSSLESITLPDSLQSIGSEAFSGCSDLTFLDLPTSLQSIGNGAFSGCASLTSFDLPNALRILEDGVFKGCSSLESITLPDSLQSIGSEAFSGCVFDHIEVPKSLQSIGEKAFSGCTKLSKLYGTHQISQLNENVFENCSELGVVQVFSYDDRKMMTGTRKDNLKTAIILQGTESIKSVAFDHCSTLKTIILPESLRTIEYGGIANTGLESIILPHSLETIGKSGLLGNPSLGSIIIPDSVKTIGGYAFERCYSLKTITLPPSLQSIGTCALESCTSLVEFDVSKISLSVTNSTNWTSVFLQPGLDRVKKIICRQEQAERMQSFFTKATLDFVD